MRSGCWDFLAGLCRRAILLEFMETHLARPRRDDRGAPVQTHVGMIAIAAGNKPSRLLHTSPNRTQEGANRQVLNIY
jgi:hypothetical protein